MLRDRLFRASLILGIGLGGFLDGIVLHQILGWHHLVCTTATCEPASVADLLRQNTQDGFFHLATWFITVVGVAMLLRASRNYPTLSYRVTVGGALAGWGTFNFVEGLIDHQILGIHHVRPDSPHWLMYDMIFLASGPILWVFGRWTARSVPRIPSPG